MKNLRPDNYSAARYTAVMGLLFAVSAALNLIETVFSAFLPAGMRVGLSNIVTMAALLALNTPSAFILVVLKGFFVFLTRGLTAGIMSFCGSFLAFAVTAALFGKTSASYVLTSVLGALAHSMGQLFAASAMLGTFSVFAYSPVLMISSLAAGTVTGIVLRTVFPVLKKRL